MNPTGSFAFLVHPRSRLSEDLARVAKPLGLVPDRVYDLALRRLPVPPMTMATVHLGSSTVGHVVLVPFGARHMIARPAQARDKVCRAVDHAVGLGASVVGLGALTAPVTAGGAALRYRADIAVTNGNAFTAAIVHEQVRRLLAGTPHGRVAVVGATGSVGATVARLLVRGQDTDGLVLVARGEKRLGDLARSLSGRGVDVVATTDLLAVRECDLVVLLTAAAGSVLEPGHLGPRAVVLDATQPRNTSPELGRQRPDVLVVDGGIVDIPSLTIRGGNIGLRDGQAYACFAETMLLSLAGRRQHFSIGVPELETVDEIREIAHGYAHLGFTTAAPTSFGRPVATDTLPTSAPLDETSAVAA